MKTGGRILKSKESKYEQSYIVTLCDVPKSKTNVISRRLVLTIMAGEPPMPFILPLLGVNCLNRE